MAETNAALRALNKRQAMKRAALFLLSLTFALAAEDPAWAPLNKAFEALRLHDYDTAIPLFEQAVSLAPGRADIRKNLAYTLLKTGETPAAREQFGEAMGLDPADLHLALEYAFLCFEATDNAPARKAEARRIFDRVRTAQDAVTAATAAQAFQNIDAPLEAGIARWKTVLATSPPTFSAHYELAQLAEQRDDLALAATHYTASFRLLPERKSVLLELARVESARGNSEAATAALIAASRADEPRAAELARERLPNRYPYVYEFRQALELDPKNTTLHRELAWLLLSMSEKDESKRVEAEHEFQTIVSAAPDDYLAAAQLGLLYLQRNDPAATAVLRNVLDHADAATANRVRTALKLPLVLQENHAATAASDPRILGEQSYNSGFLKDAKRYFQQAHEQNPVDASVILKLGWTNNLLHDDQTALRWFNQARRSADPAISTEAGRAYNNLRPALAPLRTTVWIYPLLSTRWSDLFGYGQIKTEIRQKRFPFLQPYASVRFVGDARRTTGGPAPQNLSESAFILAAGVSTHPWHNASAWFEAGGMFGYLNTTREQDYRGGITWNRTFGKSLAAESAGWFFETTDDSVFVSHFQNDLIIYSQNRTGYTSAFGPFKTQMFWNTNITFDAKLLYWATFAETGPGVRFRHPAMPRSMSVTLSAVRGIYLINEANPGRPNFNDLRAGIWYAFTK